VDIPLLNFAQNSVHEYIQHRQYSLTHSTEAAEHLLALSSLRNHLHLHRTQGRLLLVLLLFSAPLFTTLVAVLTPCGVRTCVSECTNVRLYGAKMHTYVFWWLPQASPSNNRMQNLNCMPVGPEITVCRYSASAVHCMPDCKSVHSQQMCRCMKV
jgi:hypothetical protein